MNYGVIEFRNFENPVYIISFVYSHNDACVKIIKYFDNSKCLLLMLDHLLT